MPRTGNQFQGMDGTSEVSESLNEWGQIQSPFPKLPPTSVEQDMVVTRDNNYLNDNHEGLQQEGSPVFDLELEATQDPDPESSSSSSVSSNSGGDEENGRLSQPQVANEIRRGLRLRLEILRAGVSKVACRVWNCAACARGFWLIASVIGRGGAKNFCLEPSCDTGCKGGVKFCTKRARIVSSERKMRFFAKSFIIYDLF